MDGHELIKLFSGFIFGKDLFKKRVRGDDMGWKKGLRGVNMDYIGLREICGPTSQNEGIKDEEGENRIQYSHPHILFYQSYNFPAAVTSLTARYIILHYPDGRKS